MENHLKQRQKKEIIVRKRMTSFLEKLFKFFNYDLRHDIFKSIMYGEVSPETLKEEKMKNYSDAFNYLINNSQRALSKEVLNRFYFLIYEQQLDENLIIRICSYFFNNSSNSLSNLIVEFPLYLYQQLNYLQEEDKIIITLMFVNYILAKNGYPTIHLYHSDIKEFIKLTEQYLLKESNNLSDFLENVIKNNTTQDKNYYQNLYPLCGKEIENILKNDEDLLRNQYHVESIYIHGSFAKGIARIDSDIDLIVKFAKYLSFDEKQKLIKEIENKYFEIFHRYIDIHLFDEYLDNTFIKEFIQKIKIF